MRILALFIALPWFYVAAVALLPWPLKVPLIVAGCVFVWWAILDLLDGLVP